jgi:hypothetical protein
MGDLGGNAPSDAPSCLALACESIAAYGSFAHGGKERVRKPSLAHTIEHTTKPSGQCLLPSQNTQSPGCVCLSYQLPRIRGHRRHAPTCALRPTGQASVSIAADLGAFAAGPVPDFAVCIIEVNERVEFPYFGPKCSLHGKSSIAVEVGAYKMPDRRCGWSHCNRQTQATVKSRSNSRIGARCARSDRGLHS